MKAQLADFEADHGSQQRQREHKCCSDPSLGCQYVATNRALAGRRSVITRVASPLVTQLAGRGSERDVLNQDLGLFGRV